MFECEGDTLVGVVHRPGRMQAVGLVTVVAGGPQYRAGVGRGLVEMGDQLAAQGFPVLRFDYRGMGDSGGEFRGFEQIGADLACAVAAFRKALPEIERIVLWGGCDAASGILIHAHALQGIAAIAVGNPWVSSSETQAVVIRRHYLQRLVQKSFWLKLLRLEYDLAGYAADAGRALRRRLVSRVKHDADTGPGGTVAPARGVPFIERMRRGLEAFDGPVLLLMSGRSLVSREFDALIQQNPGWRSVAERKVTQREELPDADQAFSSQSARKKVTLLLAAWLNGIVAAGE
ncbi:hydrolase 1, exosortase A system-associated [Parahaliea aestuarii]|uniref:hydrolase 1, exosortase A system-associated n=1 Tax=Parahaliea aestuarii TaxID=1852021 RepID=UPI00164F3F2A|nr:hydrolase 1, exosortase A system-associated [Parahaliea aestuarii]